MAAGADGGGGSRRAAVHLSGGEPTARPDIVEITAKCAELGLYSNLITSGVGGALAKLDALYDAGLDHVQLSVQGVDAANAEKIGGLKNAQPQKMQFAAASPNSACR